MARLALVPTAFVPLLGGCGYHEGAYLGVVGPETGEWSAYGLEGVQGAQLAVKSFSKARFTSDDLRLELLHYDTGGETARLQEHFRRLATVDGAAAIIVTSPSPEEVRLAARLADELGIAVFFTADAFAASSESGSPRVFNLTPEAGALVPEAVRIASAWSGGGPLALVSAQGALYGLYRERFRRALDDARLPYLDLELSFDAFDYASAAYRMLADGCSGVILNGTSRDLVSLLASCAELTYNPPFVALASAKPSRLELPEHYVLDQGYFVGGFSPQAPNAKTTAFVETFRNHIGYVPGAAAAASYDAARIVLRGITEADSPRADAVARALSRIRTHDGVSGAYELERPPSSVFIERTRPAATGITVELVPAGPSVPEAEPEGISPVEAGQPVKAE